MIKVLIVLLFFLSASLAAGPVYTLSGAFGFTHYFPDDLNEVNRIFEAVSRANGFKGYKVEPFNGHLESFLGAGAEWKHLSLSLEAEIWQETFSQRNVAFSTTGLSGTVNADEKYLFLPVTLMLKYPVRWRRLRITPGYGPGIMFGSAHVNMSTRYSNRPADNLDLSFTSGFNVIHRLGVDVFYKLFSWVGAGVSGGYRFSQIPYLEVAEKKGDSFIFNLIFNGGAEEGDRLYTGYETLRFIKENEKLPRDHLVVGDMTGYYLWFRLIFMIGEKPW